jgi:NADH:ubiquinone oxidoreductase subunit 4 (subunit M)
LRALKRSFFDSAVEYNENVKSATSLNREALEPITIPEKLGAGLLMFTTLAIGIYPKFLLDRIQPAVEAMRFLKTGG